MNDIKANNTICTDDYKLYHLTVKDAERARLIEIINDPNFKEPEPEDDDAAPMIVSGLWLIAAVLFTVSLMGFGLGL